MKRQYDWIIAYDIADPKRLRRAARLLEKNALRIQYSVYILPETPRSVVEMLMQTLMGICREDDDNVRLYRIDRSAIRLGDALDPEDPTAIAGGIS